MADCITAQITDNILNAFNGKTITYNGSSHSITAEAERSVTVVNNRYPFVEVAGPQTDVMSRSHNSVDAKLSYVITFRDNTINDEYSSSSSVSPITSIYKNTIADLIKLLMIDPTRGGNALTTDYDNFGYYFTGDPMQPEINLYTTISVTAQLNEYDLYYRG